MKKKSIFSIIIWHSTFLCSKCLIGHRYLIQVTEIDSINRIDVEPSARQSAPEINIPL